MKRFKTALKKSSEIRLAPNGYAKIKDHFRFQCLIHEPKVYPVNEAISHVLEKKPLPSGVRLYLDVNPLSTYFLKNRIRKMG